MELTHNKQQAQGNSLESALTVGQAISQVNCLAEGMSDVLSTGSSSQNQSIGNSQLHVMKLKPLMAGISSSRTTITCKPGGQEAL